MDTRPIGVFDSGLGGLTSVKELVRLLPGEDILYFGDTGRVPYGSRGRDSITRFAQQDVAFLQSHGVKALVCACGTISTVAGELLARTAEVPFFMVVEPASRAAAAAARSGRIGVIGTNATIRSGKFQQTLEALCPGAEVTAIPCPLFVPLVEAGHIGLDDPLTNLAVAQYLQPLADRGIDTLVLGCTHYPILAPVIDRFFGGRVTLVDSGQQAALAAAERLNRDGLLSGRTAGGQCSYYVTDDPQGFAQVAGIFLGTPVADSATQVDIGILENILASGGRG